MEKKGSKTINYAIALIPFSFIYSQGFIIALLVYFDVISSIFKTVDTNVIRNISSKLQDFLICIEMFLAAVAHHYSFSYKPFVNLAQSQAWWDAFRYESIVDHNCLYRI